MWVHSSYRLSCFTRRSQNGKTQRPRSGNCNPVFLCALSVLNLSGLCVEKKSTGNVGAFFLSAFLFHAEIAEWKNAEAAKC